METEIVVALIEVGGTLVTAAIAGYFGKKWLDQQKLQQKLKEAREDIAFLLQIEKYYLQETKEDDHILGKIKIREYITTQGYNWSGKHTPGRVKDN